MESLLFTREDLKKLIVPLIIEQALALSIGLFDTLMVSSCGEAAVSGVSLVDSISTLLIQIQPVALWCAASISARRCRSGQNCPPDS